MKVYHKLVRIIYCKNKNFLICGGIIQLTNLTALFIACRNGLNLLCLLNYKPSWIILIENTLKQAYWVIESHCARNRIADWPTGILGKYRYYSHTWNLLLLLCMYGFMPSEIYFNSVLLFRLMKLLYEISYVENYIIQNPCLILLFNVITSSSNNLINK